MLNKKKIWIIILSFCLIMPTNAGWFDDKIKVRKCYKDNGVWKNYKEYQEYQVSQRIQNRSSITKWDWDLDLKNKKALHILEVNGNPRMEEYGLLSSDNLITVKLGVADVTFNKKNETARIVFTNTGGGYTKQCVFK